MNHRARAPLIVSAAVVCGMVVYVIVFNAAHRAWAHRRAIAAQAFYVRHCRDSLLRSIEFRPLASPEIVWDTASIKYAGPICLEFYDAAAPSERRLLARVTAHPIAESRCLARCEVFFEPVNRVSGKVKHPAGDSVWRKGYYLAYAHDSVWQKELVGKFPDNRDRLRDQVKRDSL